MLTFLSIVLRFLRDLGIALWLGGLIAIGALVAPTAFHLVRQLPQLHADKNLQTAIAGGVVGGSLRIFNVVCYVCGGLIIVAEAFMLLNPSKTRTGFFWTSFSLILAIALLGSAFYLGHVLFPALDLAQQQGNLLLFDRLHHLYEQLSGLQLPLLLGIMLAGVLRDHITSVNHAPQS
jgi:hypothetical protein